MAVPRYARPIAAVPPIRSDGERRAAEAGEEQAAEHHPCAPGSEHEPVAQVAGVKRVLGEGDLDGEDEGEEDECDRLSGDESSQDGALANVGEAEPKARRPRDLLVFVVARGARKDARRREQDRNGHERRCVREERDLGAGGRDEDAGERRAGRGARGEADVEDAVALAQEPRRLEDRSGRRARAGARGGRQGAVNGGDAEHRCQQERLARSRAPRARRRRRPRPRTGSRGRGDGSRRRFVR